MQPRLDVRHLQVLLAVAETGSLAVAARMLGVTASALSHRIREAERRLDVALFTKLGRGLRLTPAGEHLADVGDRLLADLERAEAVVMRMGEGVERVVRLGMGAYNSYHWLPAFLRVYREAAPETEIDVIANAARRPLESLLEGAIDVAILAEPVLPPGLRAIPLFEDEIVAVTPPGHRLAGRDFVVAEDFADEALMTYSLIPVPGHEGERFWRPSRVHCCRATRVELVEAIVELIKAGFGTSMLARWAMAPHLRDGSLAAVRLGPEGLAIRWHAVIRLADPPDSPAPALAQALADWCAAVPDAFGRAPAAQSTRPEAQPASMALTTASAT